MGQRIYLSEKCEASWIGGAGLYSEGAERPGLLKSNTPLEHQLLTRPLTLLYY
jgi:hypothetical protein